MRHVKATFFLQLKDNDDRDLSREISEVEDECFLEFGAWTLSGHFKGVWRMESGERKIDTSTAYMVLLTREQLPELEEILKRFKAKTTQEAIFLALRGPGEYYSPLHRDPHENGGRILNCVAQQDPL